MRYLTAAAALALALARTASAAPIPPSGCPTCIQNTASPQTAQINIGTATIRGTLTASTVAVTNLSVTNLTATTFSGSGAALTSLNASQLASGTVPSARLTGSYTGITAVGTLTAGVWNGTAIGTQYGGTGQNWSTVGVGALPYFSGTGAMTTLAAGAANRILQANGAGAPSWTAAPTVLGTNVTAIPLANLSAGNLPMNVAINDASISTVSAAKIVGNISGNAAGITGTLALSKLEAGTLGVNIVAQKLNATGVSSGTYGGPTLYSQVSISTEGRVVSAAQGAIALDPSQIDPGTLPADVLVPAASVQPGSLGNTVIATSVTASGVAAGLYGGALQSASFSVGADGRITSATQYAIPSVSTRTAWTDVDNAWHGPGQTSISSWTFRGNVAIQGTLDLTSPLTTSEGGTGQNWSAIGAGRVPYFSSTGGLTTLAPGATNYVLTMSGGLPVWSVSASSAGHLAGGTAGALPYQSAPNVTAFLASSVNGYSLVQSGGIPAWAATVSSATNLAGGAAGSIPYQSAANTTALLATGTGVLAASGGAPAWTATPTLTGTNFTGIPTTAISAGGLPTTVTVSTANVVPGLNGASNLVQMTAGGLYPAASGANITALNADNLGSGTVPSARVAGGYTGITSVGTLTGLTVSGVLDLSGVNQIHQLSGHNFVQGDATTTYLYGGSAGGQIRKADNSAALVTWTDVGLATFAGDIVANGGTAAVTVNESDAGNVAINLEANSTRGLVEVKMNGTTTVQISGGSEDSFFNTGGNLGVGTGTPGTKLDVNGAATVRGQVTVTSSMTIQGMGVDLVGGQSFAATATGHSRIYGLLNKGITIQGEAGSTVQWSFLEAAGGLYHMEGTATALRLMPDGGNTMIGSRGTPVSLVNMAGTDTVLTIDITNNTGRGGLAIRDNASNRTAFLAYDDQLGDITLVRDGVSTMTLTNAGAMTFTGLFSASSATFTGTGGAYAVTLSTGIYFSAGELRFASGAGGIVFPDGTRQTSAASFTAAKASTATPSGSGSNSSFSSCMSGSTLTIVMNGGQLACGYTGAESNSSGTGVAWFAVVNGQFFPGTTATKTVFTHLNGISSTGYNNSGRLVTNGATTYTGTVSVCMGGATNSGTWVVPSASAIGFTDIAMFYCEEIK